MSTQEDFEAILASKTVSKINGDPTMKSYETLLEELKSIATRLKTNLFPMGQKYGFLALICDDHEYGDHVEDDGYIYKEPTPPEDYDTTIDATMTETQRKTREEQHKRYIVDYNKYLAVSNVLRENIVEAVNDEFIEALQDAVVGYDMISPFELLEHIKKGIPLTTIERNEMKALMTVPWDTAQTLRSYANTLDRNWKTNKRWKIAILEPDVTDHFVDQIYKHGVFEMKVMSEWEKKRSILKNWATCKKYFLEAADEIKNFNKSTAKRSGYHSAASMEETEDATEMEDNVNLVLDAMQKSAEEINAVVTTNASMEATIKEQTKQISRLLEMNNNLVKALVAAGKQVADKDKATDEDKKTSGKRNSKGRKLKMCDFCKTEHWGAGKGCLARKCNKHLRPDNWSGAEIDE
jgi:hypothetical protein